MVIEEIIPNIPKGKKAVEHAYSNCAKLKKFVTVSSNEFTSHLEKAKSDLSSIGADYKDENWDWVIVKSYYAMHHAINCLLVKLMGYYCNDHICAIITLKHFELLPDSLYLKLRNINAKFSDFTGFDVSYSLRKISQYDVRKWKNISKQDAEAIYKVAKELIAFVEWRCYT
ncbi:HEPN domain-containing protein [archaeon]|nr:HEPN domain-containing protein [archaeon]